MSVTNNDEHDLAGQLFGPKPFMTDKLMHAITDGVAPEDNQPWPVKINKYIDPETHRFRFQLDSRGIMRTKDMSWFSGRGIDRIEPTDFIRYDSDQLFSQKEEKIFRLEQADMEVKVRAISINENQILIEATLLPNTHNITPKSTRYYQIDKGKLPRVFTDPYPNSSPTNVFGIYLNYAISEIIIDLINEEDSKHETRTVNPKDVEFMFLSKEKQEFHTVRWLVAKAKIWLNHPEEDQPIPDIADGDVMAYVDANLELTPSVEKFRKWAINYSSEHLQVATSPEGHRSYILDENSVVLGDPKDTFFFFRVGACWGIVADIETEHGTIRAGYHMGGNPWGGEISCIQGFISGVSEIGKIVNMEILYNDSIATTETVKRVVEEIDEVTIHITNLREKSNAPSSHIIISGDSAEIVHKENGKRAPTETQRLFRNNHSQK